jgi:hypothetical protein
MNDSTDERLEELPEPPPLPRRRGSELGEGLTHTPEERLSIFSPERVELVLSYWLRDGLETRYEKVRRVGGPGDLGRDVIAYASAETDDPWDNYQSKRYAGKLRPSDLWPDLCKLVYYVTQGAYSAPRAYYFVAPHGVTPTTLRLLDDPEKLRAGLLKNWKKHGRGLCELSKIQDLIKGFSFPAFDVVDATDIVTGLRETPSYAVFFGGGLTKPRPPDETPPQEIQDTELKYVEALVAAYDDHCAEAIGSSDAAFAHGSYGPHLRESRQDFYCAESLRAFSRDVLAPPEDFQGLQGQLLDGVRPTADLDHANGYERVLKVCEQAARVVFDSHPLTAAVKPRDRFGMCHQLANDGRLLWVR